MQTPVDSLPDAELAVLLADPARGRDAFDALYTRHGAALLAFARSRFRNLADDLCQIAWLEAFKHRWTPADSVRAWLFRVVANRAVSDFRKARRSQGDLPTDAADGGEGPVDVVLRRERVALLGRCKDELRRRKPEWAAVVDAVLDRERPEDASARLGISRANFDQRKKRALVALGECVEPTKTTAMEETVS